MVLAPQLRQSLKILQVPALELRSAILEELEHNPALEELSYDDISIEDPTVPDSGDPDASTDDGTESSGELETDVISNESGDSDDGLEPGDAHDLLERLDEDWKQLMYEEAGERPYTSEDAERRQHFFDSLTSANSLQEDLMRQARLSEDDPETLEALEFLIGSLDDSGFLGGNLSDIALTSRLPFRKVQDAAKLLRSLEPTGIGAANVQECLLLQLRARGRQESLAARIIRNCWDQLLRRRIPEIARKLNAPKQDVQNALAEISKLDPAPGKRYSEDDNRVIEPDVTVEKDEHGVWQVIVHNDYIPRLRISPVYKQMLATGALKGKDREYIREKFRSGRFIMNAIEQRQQTLERIARQLLVFQKDFFEMGNSGLKPLTMSQIAEVVSVHETTVSRAIANKYIRTPYGVFEMKHFFTPGYQSDDGQTMSNRSVKERITRIVESEPSSKPFSDEKIARMLADEGIRIARRTVAKYREELGILPTNLRRSYS